MRPYQIFAAMSADVAEHFFDGLAAEAAPMYAQMVHAAAAAMKSRPGSVAKLPKDKKAAAMRRALARVGADPLAEEMLAVYFLQVRKDVLVEWLDALGLAHDEGSLKDDFPPEPEEAKLRACVDAFRAGEGPADRELLLAAFAAQTAIDWPVLDALIAR